MAREILFRGKRIDNGKMVEGSYCPKKAGNYEGDRFVEEIQHLIIVNMNGGGYQYAEVDPETVCQYTGLTDKNGRKIFEGDIVAYVDMTSTENGYAEMDCVGEVVWDKEEACFHVTERISAESWEVLQECNVTGNIFDNPELMEEDYKWRD